MTGRTQAALPQPPNIPLIFLTLIIVMLLASLSQMVLSSALPTIVGELHSVELMLWVITAYMLTSTITMPIYGKISDLLGRRPILVAAIVIFVAGSILGGLAPDMTTLIIARAIQGVGGGGLMILSQAAIADVIPARDRGKYMGIMGGVFAFSSVAGPLLGGWITEVPGWRWAFWLNVPLGVLATVATVALLRLPRIQNDTRPKLDYMGMGLLAVLTTAIVLIGTWGGSVYSWDSPVILGLVAALLVSGALFVLVESRAAEPIIPLALFKDRNFNLATFAGLLVAVGMFGAIGYMPTYFQMAKGATATVAGLLMIPMMATLLITSIGAGVIVSKTGRYRMLPFAGAVILALGLGLLATVNVETPVWMICTWMGIMGVGLGANMQLLTLIVQNSFPHRIVGTATAANNYFRQVGSSLGSAIVGSVFALRLTGLLGSRLPEGAGPADGASSLTPGLVMALPEPVRRIIVESYNEALIPIFIYMVPLAVVTAVMVWFIEERPLSTRVGADADVAPPKQEAVAAD